MSEPAMYQTRWTAWANRLSGEASGGWFKTHLFLLDGTFAAWLAYAFAVFRGYGGPGAWQFAAWVGLGTALAWCASGHHGRWRSQRVRLAIGAMALAFLLMLVVALSTARACLPAEGSAILWLVVALGGTGAALRHVLAALQVDAGWSAVGESLRWITLLAGGTVLLLPFYSHLPLGAGDAAWYTLMLSDFAEQVRLGQFPVWVGATEFGFNGTFSPLRLAPLFQHAGAALDLLTARSLEYLALKNALIAIVAVATGFSTYFCLRAVLPRQPSGACLLALATMSSPATLSPLYVGDQYMTFFTLPVLPVAVYGLWRAAVRFDMLAHVLLAASVSALWLTHPPIALWTSFAATLAYGMILFARRRERLAPFVALGVGLFLVLGTFPILSALTLDNTSTAPVLGSVAGQEVAKAFPAIFQPLSEKLNQPSDYQFGYLLLGLLFLALTRLPSRRPLAAVVLLVPTLFYAATLTPIPWFTAVFWEHMPALVMQATNVWPMQRLVPITAFLIVFAFSAVHADYSGRPVRFWFVFLPLLVLALAWSGKEARRLVTSIYATRPSGPQALLFQAKHNLILTRYCFAPFAYSPAYFSHGYIDPVLEHRLLRHDLTPLLANAESAVRRGVCPAPDPDGGALLAQGTWRAVNDNGSDYYNLAPRLTFPPFLHLALRVDALEPGQTGWLQILGQDVFREYMLPDSGTGMDRRLPPRSFGTTPTSSRVISLFTREPQESPRLINIAPQHSPAKTDFDFARYELWRYDPATLPIVVKSWVPYRVILESPEPAYLETPRLWLGGYRAKVNGQRVPVERSPDNLAMFAVPAGHSDVTIKFVPSLSLELLYWTCLLGWLVLLLVGVGWLTRLVTPNRARGSIPVGPQDQGM